MTQDEIIEMAGQSGFLINELHCSPPILSFVGQEESMQAFAKLVAEREREACAKIADEWAVGWPHPSQVIAERIRSRGET